MSTPDRDDGLAAAADPSRLWEELHRDGERIVLLVIDGLGGLTDPGRGVSELQAARTPCLDELARASSCGLVEPVGPGVTPGSGPGHLALFGYHPLRYRIGRGVLSALGVDFPLRRGDVAARVNLAALGPDGRVADRRAGRPPTSTARALCARVREAVDLGGEIEWFLEPVKEHRAVLVLRGEGLGGALEDTDPHRTGVPPRPVEARDEASRRTAALVASLLEQAGRALEGQPAQALLLRGFDRHGELPSLEARFGLAATCLAGYPMYRGLSRLLGMQVPALAGEGPGAVVGEGLRAAWRDAGRDFLFVHFKPADAAGEDGDFDAKVAALEQADGLLPALDHEPPVLVVTGDHSTPAVMGAHSFHPVPILLRAATARRDAVTTFDEQACLAGALGLRPSLHVMGLALGHAGRLDKYGA